MFLISSWLLLFLELQIPEEEKNLGPHDRLIHVYHFTKETAQNQMVLIQNKSTELFFFLSF